jgi:ribosomal protein S18 acetylase RimI-like enzyme
MTSIHIRSIENGDFPALWSMLEPVFRKGDTYAIDPDITQSDALAYWTGPGRTVYVAELDGVVVGSFYIVANQGGGGRHVCNCGFVTGPAARKKGVASAMLSKALKDAAAMGFRAMQFNFVVSSNTTAVGLWQRAGFDIVGRLPEAFHHPEAGYVDALVMYRSLADQAE